MSLLVGAFSAASTHRDAPICLMGVFSSTYGDCGGLMVKDMMFVVMVRLRRIENR